MKDFYIFKIDNKKQDKDPDYRLTIKLNSEFVEAGAGWIKTSPKGTKYISCRLSKPYKDRKGFILEVESNTDGELPIIKQDEVVDDMPF